MATAALAAGLVLAGLLLARDLYQSTLADAQRNLTSLTILLAQQADETLDAIDLAQAAMIDEPVGSDLETAESFALHASTFATHAQLSARSAAVPQLSEVMIVDAGGKLLASSRAWPAPAVDFSQSAFFKDLASAKRTIVVAPHEGQGLDLYLAHPIVGADGRRLGVSLGKVDLLFFEALYKRVSSDAADVISIVHNDGTMLARHPCPPGVIGMKMPQLPSMQSASQGRRGATMDRIVSLIDRHDRFIATQSLAHYPMIVGVSRTADAVLAGWRKQAMALGVATTLLIAGLLALAWVAARQLRDQQRLAGSEAARLAAEERARGECRLRQEYVRFATALDNMRQGLALFDADGSLVVLSARFADIYAVPDNLRAQGVPAETLYAHIGLVMESGASTDFLTELREAAGASHPSQLSCPLADGRIIGLSVAPVATGGFVCTCEDDTERRRAEATIAHMAHHDALTGLPNRLLLSEATRHLLDQPGRRAGGAMLLLDLDGFKQVNDRHGHLLGDALLQGVAARLQGLLGPDDVLARLGGDEFALVRHKDAARDGGAIQPADAIAMAGRIVAAMAAPFVIEAQSLTIGTSIGIALADTPQCTPDRLLRNADIALYQAKAAGRGTWRLYAASTDAGAGTMATAPRRAA